MKKLFLLILIAFCIHGKSQSNNSSKVELCKEVENTYQIVSHNARYKLAITTDICEIVKKERKKEETFIYKVNEYYSIKIYSEKDIPFIKLPLQHIIYKEN